MHGASPARVGARVGSPPGRACNARRNHRSARDIRSELICIAPNDGMAPERIGGDDGEVDSGALIAAGPEHLDSIISQNPPRRSRGGSAARKGDVGPDDPAATNGGGIEPNHRRDGMIGGVDAEAPRPRPDVELVAPVETDGLRLLRDRTRGDSENGAEAE